MLASPDPEGPVDPSPAGTKSPVSPSPTGAEKPVDPSSGAPPGEQLKEKQGPL